MAKARENFFSFSWGKTLDMRILQLFSRGKKDVLCSTSWDFCENLIFRIKEEADAEKGVSLLDFLMAQVAS